MMINVSIGMKGGIMMDIAKMIDHTLLKADATDIQIKKLSRRSY